MARPKKVLEEKDINQMKVLARCHCPDSEIAAFLGVGETTLKRRFGPLLKSEREAGKANIRRWQMDLAQKGNATLLIWLGKQLLGQRDNMTLDSTSKYIFEVITSKDRTVMGVLPDGEQAPREVN